MLKKAKYDIEHNYKHSWTYEDEYKYILAVLNMI